MRGNPKHRGLNVYVLSGIVSKYGKTLIPVHGLVGMLNTVGCDNDVIKISRFSSSIKMELAAWNKRIYFNGYPITERNFAEIFFESLYSNKKTMLEVIRKLI